MNNYDKLRCYIDSRRELGLSPHAASAHKPYPPGTAVTYDGISGMVGRPFSALPTGQVPMRFDSSLPSGTNMQRIWYALRPEEVDLA